MKGRITLALLLVTALLLNMCLIGVNVSPVSAQEVWPLPVPRDETIALCGYWPDPSWATSVPIIADWGQCMETYIMYEPLFGTDVASNTRINWLGKNIEWVDPTTIRITLRSGPYWVKITDWDAWQAGTGGVEYYRPINATDVWFSFYLLGGLPESPDGKYYQAGALRDRIINMTVVDDKTLLVYLKPEYANSIVVWRRLTASYLIVPADVWSEIEAEYGWIPDVGNRWTDPAFRAAHPNWLVTSGMYLPYQQQVAERPHYTLMKKNPIWWGISVFGRQPAPKYSVYLNLETNEQIYEWLANGWVDWCGIVVPYDFIQQYPFLHTYLDDPPYYIDEGAQESIVPNHRKYPLGEQWLNHAICHILNFSNFDIIIPPSPLYLSEVVRNETINEYFVNEYFNGTYVQIPYVQDVQEAIEILNATCYYIYNGEIQGWNTATNRPYNWPNGAWYTKEGPCQQWLENYLTDDVDLTIGNVTHPASYWLKHGLSEADELPLIPGVNVQLGPWTIIDWLDGNAVTCLIADWMTELLDIPIQPSFIAYSDFESRMNELNYELSHYYFMPSGLGLTICDVYTQLFTGVAGMYAHPGDYRNPTLETLLNCCDSSIPRTVLYKAEYVWGKYDNDDSVGTEPPYATFAGDINADNVKRSDDVREAIGPITWHDYVQHIYNFTLPLGITKDMVISINVTWEGFILGLYQGSAGELMVWNHTSLQWDKIATIPPSLQAEDMAISVPLPSKDYIDSHGRIYVMAMAYPSWEPPPLLATDYVQVELRVSPGNNQEITNKVQWIVGSDEPLIPIANAPHPYVYSDLYWVRWPNETHPFLPCSPYGGSSQTANLHFILLSLGMAGWAEDINNDGWIDMKDIISACKAYGSYPGHPKWDFPCDITSNGLVDMQDIIPMCRRYGQHR